MNVWWEVVMVVVEGSGDGGGGCDGGESRWTNLMRHEKP